MRPEKSTLPVCTRRNRDRRRRAFSSLYIGLLFVPLAGFASLSIDIGRVRLARADLQAGADSAARAAASGLPLSVYDCQTRATTFATANKCLNTPIALNAASDLEFGRWNVGQRTFTPLTDSNTPANNPARAANAVRVTTYRTAARNGPVPLTIASALNVTSADVATYAVAMIRGGPTRFGVVALDQYKSNGNNSLIDSYDPALGPYRADQARSNASLVSNGNIDLGNGDVYGDVRAGIDKTTSQGPGSDIYGWTNNLDQVLSYPAPTVPDNAIPLPTVSKDSPPIPGGTPGNPIVYKTTTLGGDLSFTGAVQIYVYGNPGSVTLTGGRVITSGDLPANLEVYVTGSGDVNMNGTSALYAHVYAPLSNVLINGTPDYMGWIVGKTVTLKGTANIHYDESLPSGAADYKIALVK